MHDSERVPKLTGSDNEFSNVLVGAGPDHGGAALLLLNQISGFRSHMPSLEMAPPYSMQGQSLEQAGEWGRRFLPNGACAYMELGHLELCTPEVLSAWDHLACTRALFAMAHTAALKANRGLPEGQKIHVLANNSDGNNNAWGSHLNFLINRETLDNLFRHRLHYLLNLATYQASSIVLTGQGKVGAENGRPHVPFQLSQRADFFEMLVGPQTTHTRPIVNTRDEPLCGLYRSDESARSLARLHVIFYDHNLCQAASILKIGVMQILLSMMEAGVVNSQLILERPVTAVHEWSHDPELQVRMPLVCGKRVTAVELQLCFLELAARFVRAGGCDDLVPNAEEILELWRDTLENLERRDYAALSRRLDWALKWTILEQALRKHPEFDWNSPELKYLDQLYSSLDPVAGLYWAYERGGLVEQFVTPSQIDHFVHHPPADTRAWIRATLLNLAQPEEVVSVDWDRITIELAGDYGQRRVFRMPNPLRGTKAQMAHRLSEVRDLRAAFNALRMNDDIRLPAAHIENYAP